VANEETEIPNDAGPNELEALRTALDSFRSLTLRRFAARARWLNSVTPISHLPAEILSRIFELVLEDERQGEQTHSLPQKPRLTQVCSHWREVALDTPKLWSYIDSDYGKAANAAYFTRSKQSPLHVVLKRPAPASFGYPGPTKWSTIQTEVHKVARESHRLKLFQLRCEDASPAELSALFSRPAPLLEDLALYPIEAAEESGGDGLEVRGQYSTTVFAQNGHLGNLFGGKAPKLQNLLLSMVALPWASTLFGPQLSRLTLHDLPSQVRPSAHEVLSLLQRTPQLTHLSISSIAPVNVGTPFDDEISVPLNHLTDARLEAESAWALRKVLSHLVAPNVWNMLASCVLSPGPQPIFTLIQPPPASSFESVISSWSFSINTIIFLISGDQRFEASLKDKTLMVYGTTTSLQTAIGDFGGLMPTWPITCLKLAWLKTDGQEAGIAAIRNFSRTLQQLFLMECRSHAIIDYICSPAENTTGSDVRWPMPSLSHLNLENCIFDPRTLSQGMKKRFENAEEGAVEKEFLVIRSCNMNSDAYSELVEVLGAEGVDWDGSTESLLDGND